MVGCVAHGLLYQCLCLYVLVCAEISPILKLHFPCLSPVGATPSAASMHASPEQGNGVVRQSFMHTPLRHTLRSYSTLQGTPAQAQAQVSSPFHPAQSNMQCLLALFYKRAADNKSAVRKAAIQALESMLLCMIIDDRAVQSAPSIPAAASDDILYSLTPAHLQIFYDGCMDQSVSIRKQAMTSLSTLFSYYPTSALLQKIWLGAVLPMIHDSEGSIQERCCDMVWMHMGCKLEQALESVTIHVHIMHASIAYHFSLLTSLL